MTRQAPSKGIGFVAAVILLLAGGGFYALSRPSQRIEDVLREVQKGWTERMVRDRFPRMAVTDDRLFKDDPDWPTQNTLTLHEGDEGAVVNCFAGMVRQVSVVSKDGYKVVWGNLSENVDDFYRHSPTPKIVKERNARWAKSTDDFRRSEEQRAQNNAAREAERRAQEQRLDEQRASYDRQIAELERQMDRVTEEKRSASQAFFKAETAEEQDQCRQRESQLHAEFFNLLEKRNALESKKNQLGL